MTEDNAALECDLFIPNRDVGFVEPTGSKSRCTGTVEAECLRLLPKKEPIIAGAAE